MIAPKRVTLAQHGFEGEEDLLALSLDGDAFPFGRRSGDLRSKFFEERLIRGVGFHGITHRKTDRKRLIGRRMAGLAAVHPRDLGVQDEGLLLELGRHRDRAHQQGLAFVALGFVARHHHLLRRRPLKFSGLHALRQRPLIRVASPTIPGYFQ